MPTNAIKRVQAIRVRTQTGKRVETVRVRTPTASYPVVVGAGVLGECGRRIRRLLPGRPRVFVISSPRVWRLWGRPLAASLRAAGFRFDVLLMRDREEDKRLATVERLAGELLACGAERGSLVAALGGGVVGDITGFLAATYMRGVPYVQIPTTLVAQADAALGGKTGVNLALGKNLLGAFHHPQAVFADTRTLATLPARDFRAGLYEVLKCAIIGDPFLFRFLERNMRAILQRQPPAVRTALLRAMRLKARIVSRDEREAHLRQVLNFGHTFGHAFETLGGYRTFRHGEAVAWGMAAATRLALGLKRLPPVEAARILRLIDAVGRRPALPPWTPEQIYRQLFADKKKRGGELRFVLPRRIGRVEIVRGIPRREVLVALRGLAAAPPAR